MIEMEGETAALHDCGGDGGRGRVQNAETHSSLKARHSITEDIHQHEALRNGKVKHRHVLRIIKRININREIRNVNRIA